MINSEFIERYLYVRAICRHEFFIDIGASLSDAALRGIDAAPAPNLQKIYYEL